MCYLIGNDRNVEAWQDPFDTLGSYFIGLNFKPPTQFDEIGSQS